MTVEVANGVAGAPVPRQVVAIQHYVATVVAAIRDA
jgi:hypothetical protein